jgi:hypothetical protein
MRIAELTLAELTLNDRKTRIDELVLNSTKFENNLCFRK